MKGWIAFWNILAKDMRTYYLKPPNISWGLLFPLVWIAMFFIRSGMGIESLRSLLPGLVALSILFGTTSVLSVTVTFEKKPSGPVRDYWSVHPPFALGHHPMRKVVIHLNGVDAKVH